MRDTLHLFTFPIENRCPRFRLRRCYHTYGGRTRATLSPLPVPGALREGAHPALAISRSKGRAVGDRCRALRIAKLVAAFGDGAGPAAFVHAIQIAEARLAEIEAERARLAATPALGILDLRGIEREIAQELTRFAALLRGNVSRARQLLKKLLVDRVEFRPVTGATGRRSYAFTGELFYGAVLREVISLTKVAQENFARIQSGMTEAEVTPVLGPPTESNSTGFGPVGGTTSMWKDNGRIITIQFVNGKVLAKAFSGKTP